MIVKFKKLPGGTWFCTEGKEWEQAQVAGSVIEYEVDDPEKPWTPNQKGAMYIWLRDLAVILNDAGLERVVIMEELAKHGIELPWTRDSAKELLWKPILKVQAQKESTEDQSTTNPSEISMIISRRLSERYGVTCPPWPSAWRE